MRILQVGVLAVALAATCNAGLLIVEKTVKLGERGTNGTSRISAGQENLKVESTGENGAQVMLYKGSEETLYIADLKKGSYMKLSKQQLEQMMNQVGDQMAQMKAMMEEQLKNVPPEQRAMVEKMMMGKMGNMGGSEPEKIVYRKVSSGETIGKWKCDKYEQFQGEKKLADVWTTDSNALGMSLDDFSVFKELADMLTGLTSKIGSAFPQIGPAIVVEGQYTGLPVQRISYDNGKPFQRHEVEEVAQMDFDSSIFALPDGLREEKMPGLERFSAPSNQ
jgi:hypothetical protein